MCGYYVQISFASKVELLLESSIVSLNYEIFMMKTPDMLRKQNPFNTAKIQQAYIQRNFIHKLYIEMYHYSKS